MQKIKSSSLSLGLRTDLGRTAAHNVEKAELSWKMLEME